jgi:hypothetical protein
MPSAGKNLSKPPTTAFICNFGGPEPAHTRYERQIEREKQQQHAPLAELTTSHG